jgi:SAM-dependent methyltransferase
LFYADKLAEIDTAAAVLAQLFLLCAWVPAARLDRLDPALTALLRRLGLIEPVAGNERLVCGVVALTEFRDHYFLSDALFENQSRNFVVHKDGRLCMPPHASSLELLAGLRRPTGARSFLDVGCGTGCLSLLFASGYDRITGFDPSPRAVGFARVNALMNNTRAWYQTDTWESFHVDAPYDHVAFNTPDDSLAFDFINFGIDKVLAPTGHAQVWLTCEVTREDGSFEGTLQRRIKNPEKFRIETLKNDDSPFSIKRELMQSGRLPDGTLLVSDPTEKDAHMNDLAERRVAEVVSATLTIRHRR